MHYLNPEFALKLLVLEDQLIFGIVTQNDNLTITSNYLDFFIAILSFYFTILFIAILSFISQFRPFYCNSDIYLTV